MADSDESKALLKQKDSPTRADREYYAPSPSSTIEDGYLSTCSSEQSLSQSDDCREQLLPLRGEVHSFFGVTCVLASTVGFSLASVLVKQDVQASGARFPTIEIAIIRAIFGCVLGMTGIRLFNLPILPNVSRPVLQLALLRGVLDFSASNLFYFSCSQAPVASATVVFFMNPLWVGLLAKIFLDEPLNRERICALIVGGIGVMISLWPELKQPDSYSGLAAAGLGSIFQAGQYVAGRVCCQSDMHWLHQSLAYSLAGFALGPAALLATTSAGYADEAFVPPWEWTSKEICITSAIVACALSSQLWLIKGMAYIPATTTAIIRTLDIPMAFVWVSLLLDEQPNVFQIIGGVALVWACVKVTQVANSCKA